MLKYLNIVLKFKMLQNMSNQILNSGYLYYESNFNLTLLLFKHLIKNI